MFLLVVLFTSAALAAPRCSWHCDDPTSTCVAKFPLPRCRVRGCGDGDCTKYVGVREVPNEMDPTGCPAGEVRVFPPASGPCSIANGCTYECEMLGAGWWECPPPPPPRCEYNCEFTTCTAFKVEPADESDNETAMEVFLYGCCMLLVVVLNSKYTRGNQHPRAKQAKQDSETAAGLCRLRSNVRHREVGVGAGCARRDVNGAVGQRAGDDGGVRLEPDAVGRCLVARDREEKLHLRGRARHGGRAAAGAAPDRQAARAQQNQVGGEPDTVGAPDTLSLAVGLAPRGAAVPDGGVGDKGRHGHHGKAAARAAVSGATSHRRPSLAEELACRRHTIMEQTSFAIHSSGNRTPEMQMSQRKHDMATKAIRAFQQKFPHVVPDRDTPCSADMGHDTAGCADFWLFPTDIAIGAVCHRHVRAHICFWENKYCDRCNVETGVCPITNFPELTRFGNAHQPQALDVDVHELLAAYARAHGILTHIEPSPRHLCGAHCPRWWPHPNGRAWICQTHHWPHQCSPDSLFCEFVGEDTGNAETTACPISGYTGRSGRVFATAKRRPTRAPRIKAPVTQEWVACCTRAVIKDLFEAHVDSWAAVLWQLFSLSGLAESHDHQWIFDAVIGILTILPTQSVTVRGVTLIPELAYMVSHVPDKLLNGVPPNVSMSSGLFSHDLRNHVVAAKMNTPRKITVATRTVFATLNKLSPDTIAFIAATLGAYFPDPLHPNLV